MPLKENHEPDERTVNKYYRNRYIDGLFSDIDQALHERFRSTVSIEAKQIFHISSELNSMKFIRRKVHFRLKYSFFFILNIPRVLSIR